MELLPSFGVNSELSRDEFVRSLRCENSAEQVRSLRQLLFSEAVRLNLADDGDVLVTRKKMNAGKAVVEKHCEDVWSLSCAIRRNERVPRVLLKNGKRGKEDFVRSQSRQREKADGGSGTDGCEVDGGSLSPGAGCQMLLNGVNGSLSLIVECKTQAVKVADSGRTGVVTSEADQSDISNRNLVGSSSSSNATDVGDCVGKNIRESAIVESINSLRREVGELRLEVRKLKTTGAASSQTGKVVVMVAELERVN